MSCSGATRFETPAGAAKPKSKKTGKASSCLGADDKQLNCVAASIVMTTMYAARMAKPEMLRCVNMLATQLTRWTDLEDKKLHRAMSYLYHRSDDALVGWIAD